MLGSNKVIRLVAPAQDKSGGTDSRADAARADSVILVHALREGEPWAERAFLEGQTALVERTLTRILGWHSELDDLTQEVFTRAFARVEELREPEALRSWLSAIAVFVAREAIRRRKRRRWLLFLPAPEVPEMPAQEASPEARAALRAFYEVIEALDADTRIVFSLHWVGGMELSEIAEVCAVSLATIKRRMKRATADFYARGRFRPELMEWFEEGSRWRHIKS